MLLALKAICTRRVRGEYDRVQISNILLPKMGKSVLLILASAISFISIVAFSCDKENEYLNEEVRFSYFTDTVSVIETKQDWNSGERKTISQFGGLTFYHQSAAAYGEYVFFVTEGRDEICLYSLTKKKVLYTLRLAVANRNVYHCNQSSFGIEKYDASDSFPLLYISQRAKSDGRCFIEVFRIITHSNEELSEYESFTIELVQSIYLPKMSYENSLGNANCVIDSSNNLMYVYSRNNDSNDDNYGQCKITVFAIPDAHLSNVYLEDDSIVSSFMLDISAFNMQGACIHGDYLYIGQGMQSVGYIFLNVIDLKQECLAVRINLQDYGVSWEPEGCFFYDDSVMLSHTYGICRIEQ